jgi:hypothetical protein
MGMENWSREAKKEKNNQQQSIFSKLIKQHCSHEHSPRTGHWAADLKEIYRVHKNFKELLKIFANVFAKFVPLLVMRFVVGVP